MPFISPNEHERLAAIGSLAALPKPLQRAFTPHDDFQPIPSPGPHDWLSNHPETSQTFEDFLKSCPNQPDTQRTVLYLQPLGTFAPGATSPSLAQLVQFSEAFFSLPVVLLRPLDMGAGAITSRQNPHTRQRQWLTKDILHLLGQQLPADAFALLAITMEDLYPDPTWNFVFGQASLRHRVGVYSFARYDPRFFGERWPANGAQVLLRRSCKVLAHEMAHIFGITHCLYYHCLMNGSNHLAESDARPLHLCPVDLRKLHHSIQFDVQVRYQDLLHFAEQAGFLEEVVWLRDRLAYL